MCRCARCPLTRHLQKKLSGHPNIVQFCSAASIGKEESDTGQAEFLLLTELCKGTFLPFPPPFNLLSPLPPLLFSHSSFLPLPPLLPLPSSPLLLFLPLWIQGGVCVSHLPLKVEWPGVQPPPFHCSCRSGQPVGSALGWEMPVCLGPQGLHTSQCGLTSEAQSHKLGQDLAEAPCWELMCDSPLCCTEGPPQTVSGQK